MMLIIGALMGFISVAFGAYAEHGLREMLTQDQLRHILTAVRYNEIYAVLISVLGLVLMNKSDLANSILFRLAGVFFIVGAILFSFSIYIAYIFNVSDLIKITPYGGVTLMFAWLLLLLTGALECAKKSTRSE